MVRGSTNIRLRDRNMKDPNVSHAPYVTVNVVHPHRLSLALLPERSWATVLDKSHAIQVAILVKCFFEFIFRSLNYLYSN